MDRKSNRIKAVKSDICIITFVNRIVGVVEVKKPTKKLSILEQPTVLGGLLVQAFYCSGPVFGILTTLDEWFFAWFPCDHQHFVTEDLNSQQQPF